MNSGYNTYQMITEIFRVTMERYRISAKQLSKVSGVSENHISEFRRHKTGISTEVLGKLLDAMEEIQPGSRAYFCSRLANGNDAEITNQKSAPKELESLWEIQNLVDGLSDNQLALLLMVIATRIKANALASVKGMERIG